MAENKIELGPIPPYEAHELSESLKARNVAHEVLNREGAFGSVSIIPGVEGRQKQIFLSLNESDFQAHSDLFESKELKSPLAIEDQEISFEKSSSDFLKKKRLG